MTVFTVVGWLGTTVVLCGYLYATVKRRLVVLHWANVVGSVMLVAFSVSVAVWPNVVLSTFFGATGVAGILREKSLRNKNPQLSFENRTPLVHVKLVSNRDGVTGSHRTSDSCAPWM